MIIGSPTATSTNAPGLKWVCLSAKDTRFPELNDIPQKACAAGIMSVHHFPAYVLLPLPPTPGVGLNRDE